MPRASQATYIDTSVWCAYCFNETQTPGAVRWLAQASLDKAATAVWSRTEFASAAAVMLRAKTQAKGAVLQAARAFDAALAMTHCLDVVHEDFLYAAELCRGKATGLRSGDALHLAVASRHGCEWLACLDHAMGAAAVKLGFKLVKFD